jgi:hypothetical protein
VPLLHRYDYRIEHKTENNYELQVGVTEYRKAQAESVKMLCGKKPSELEMAILEATVVVRANHTMHVVKSAIANQVFPTQVHD